MSKRVPDISGPISVYQQIGDKMVHIDSLGILSFDRSAHYEQED
jgi:hypothetical protein